MARLLCYICRGQIVNTTLMEHIRRWHPERYRAIHAMQDQINKEHQQWQARA